MTTRDRTAFSLVAGGAVGLVAAAGAYGGFVAALTAASLVLLIAGVLLGLTDDPGAP